MAITWPSLPGSSVPSRRPTPAIAAAFFVRPARAWSAVKPGRDELADDCAGTCRSARFRRSRRRRARRPWPARRPCRPAPSTSALRWARTPQRLVALGRLASCGYSSSVGTLGSSGKFSREHDGDLGRLEPVGDLGGLAAADDHGGRAELLGQVERAVDLVAGVGLPPDRQLLRPGGLESLERRVERRLAAAVRLVDRRRASGDGRRRASPGGSGRSSPSGRADRGSRRASLSEARGGAGVGPGRASGRGHRGRVTAGVGRRSRRASPAGSRTAVRG